MTDAQLAAPIEKGDFCETATGCYEANSNGHSRYGTCYEYHFVNCWKGNFGIPIDCRGINAIWRKGICVWRRGESLRQLELFEGVA
jgi:hypothetical protein